MRQGAHREAGSRQNNFFTCFYMLKSFNCFRDIVYTSTEPVQLRWPGCNIASDFISVLQLFTGTVLPFLYLPSFVGSNGSINQGM